LLLGHYNKIHYLYQAEVCETNDEKTEFLMHTELHRQVNLAVSNLEHG